MIWEQHSCPVWQMYQCFRYFTTYCRLGGLNNRCSFSHSCGGFKFTVKVSAYSISGEASLPGLQIATFSLCAHMDVSICTRRERERSLASLSLLRKTLIRLDWVLTLRTFREVIKV